MLPVRKLSNCKPRGFLLTNWQRYLTIILKNIIFEEIKPNCHESAQYEKVPWNPRRAADRGIFPPRPDGFRTAGIHRPGQRGGRPFRKGSGVGPRVHPGAALPQSIPMRTGRIGTSRSAGSIRESPFLNLRIRPLPDTPPSGNMQMSSPS